jgi:hypothetical protein
MRVSTALLGYSLLPVMLLLVNPRSHLLGQRLVVRAIVVRHSHFRSEYSCETVVCAKRPGQRSPRINVVLRDASIEIGEPLAEVDQIALESLDIGIVHLILLGPRAHLSMALRGQSIGCLPPMRSKRRQAGRTCRQSERAPLPDRQREARSGRDSPGTCSPVTGSSQSGGVERTSKPQIPPPALAGAYERPVGSFAPDGPFRVRGYEYGYSSPMTTPQNYESPSEQAVPGPGGYFEPEDDAVSETEEEPESVVPEEDDERARRQEDRERRAEDDAP